MSAGKEIVLFPLTPYCVDTDLSIRTEKNILERTFLCAFTRANDRFWLVKKLIQIRCVCYRRSV